MWRQKHSAQTKLVWNSYEKSSLLSSLFAAASAKTDDSEKGNANAPILEGDGPLAQGMDANVALINDVSGILPLSQNTRLAVMGRLSTSILQSYYASSLLIDCFPSCIGYAPGIPGESMRYSAEKLARDAECVLMFLHIEPSQAGQATHLTADQRALMSSVSSLARRIIVVISEDTTAVP